MLVVESGAQASGTVVSGPGAELIVGAGGTASGTTLAGGGFDIVLGTAVSTTISSGGIETDSGIVRGAQVNSGGLLGVQPGALASGVVVMSGGDLFVFSGATASDTTLSGGYMVVEGPVGASTVTFAGGGIRQLEDSLHFAGLVAGFAQPDLLDLGDIAFISGTTTVNFVEAPSNLSGTLTVGDGTPQTTANITLLGQYTAGQFHIQGDGAAGTTVTGPPASGSIDANPTTLVNTHPLAST